MIDGLASEYIVVDKHAAEELLRVVRADKDMLREVLRDSLPFIYAGHAYDRAARAIEVTECRARG